MMPPTDGLGDGIGDGLVDVLGAGIVGVLGDGLVDVIGAGIVDVLGDGHLPGFKRCWCRLTVSVSSSMFPQRRSSRALQKVQAGQSYHRCYPSWARSTAVG